MTKKSTIQEHMIQELHKDSSRNKRRKRCRRGDQVEKPQVSNYSLNLTFHFHYKWSAKWVAHEWEGKKKKDHQKSEKKRPFRGSRWRGTLSPSHKRSLAPSITPSSLHIHLEVFLNRWRKPHWTSTSMQQVLCFFSSLQWVLWLKGKSTTWN